jgi:choline monooxygenase
MPQRSAGRPDALSNATSNVMSAVDRPIAEASGLPNAWYTDADALEAEFESIFSTGWFCLGFGKDIPKPGDVKPVDLLGRPLLLLRDRAGEIRVFHNVCSHRGMTLVQQATSKLRVLRCPYHHWCYDLSGALSATPNVGGAGVHDHADFDKSGKGLKEVRSAVWFDLVFVDLGGTAEDFDQFIAPLAARWSIFMDARLFHGGDDSSGRLEVGANWKLAVENYCESYHLPAIHPGLNSYSRLEDHYDIMESDRFSGQGSRVYQPMLSEDGRSFKSLEGLPSEWSTRAEYISLYPNVLLGIHHDHFFAVRLDPIGPGKTVEELEIYYMSEASIAGDCEDLRRANLRLWGQVFEEDIFAVEGMQAGRRSAAFSGGAFSPAMDQPTHCFHKWLAKRLADTATGRRPAM